MAATSRMNPTIKEATVKRFHYDSHDQLRVHLADFLLLQGNSPLNRCLSLLTYNFALRLKTLSALTLYEYVCKIWTSEPDLFILDPVNPLPGSKTYQIVLPLEGLRCPCLLECASTSVSSSLRVKSRLSPRPRCQAPVCRCPCKRA